MPQTPHKAPAILSINSGLTPRLLMNSPSKVKRQDLTPLYSRELFRYKIEPGLIEQIRKASNGGYVLGTEHFQQQIAKTVGQRTWRGKPGRPVEGDKNSK